MNRADRSAATVRSAYRIVRRMAGSGANVNNFLLGRDNGEGQLIVGPWITTAQQGPEETGRRPV